MKITVSNPREAGLAVRAVRKSQAMNQDELAGCANVGLVFVSEAERGKETMEFGRFMRLLSELGIRMEFDIPEEAAEQWQRLTRSPSYRDLVMPDDKRLFDLAEPQAPAAEKTRSNQG